ncbi:hypothetical protein [Hungatella effluvii]
MEIKGRLTTDQAPIIQWNDTGHDNQQWIFTAVD